MKRMQDFASLIFIIGGGLLFLLLSACSVEQGTSPAQSSQAAVSDPSLIFLPDEGIRMDYASNPGVKGNDDGSVSLLYENHAGNSYSHGIATAQDGLSFSQGEILQNEKEVDYFRAMELPDGTFRAYSFDTQGMISESSSDGINFVQDQGYRYLLQPEDHGKTGVFDLFADAKGGIVLLYLADLGGLNNLRRAYSSDGGLSFSFDRGNILGDDSAGGGAASYVDEKALLLPDGRIRLFVMKQGTIYSFLSDDGETFTLEQGIRLQPSDFSSIGNVITLHDPQPLLLSDGRSRIYVTAMLDEGVSGPSEDDHSVIVSATSQA